MSRETFGRYTAVKGKLAQDDARDAYVVRDDGRVVASFWRYDEACQWASDRAADEARPWVHERRTLRVLYAQLLPREPLSPRHPDTMAIDAYRIGSDGSIQVHCVGDAADHRHGFSRGGWELADA